MTDDRTQGTNQRPSGDDRVVDLSASLTSRAAPGNIVRVDRTPKYSQRDWQGKTNPVDLDRPFVSLTSGHGADYQRGSLVYPIGHEGEVPGTHHSEGWVCVTSLNVHQANFLGVEIGRGAISLKELVEASGPHTGISAELKGKDVKFLLKGKPIDREDAINTLLDHHAMLRIPESVRTAGLTSKVGAIEETMHESGIICNSVEEVAYLLKGYDSGTIRSSRATEDKLIEDIGASHGALGVGLLALGMKSIEGGRASLVDRLIVDVDTAIKSGRAFSKHYDYDGMGSAFFKTSVKVEPAGDKLILEINAAYVGDKPEAELATAAGKERALTSVGARLPLTQLDTNFIGIDLGAALSGSEFDGEFIAKQAAGEVDGYAEEKPTFKGKYGSYAISVGIGQNDNYHPDVFRAKGTGLYMNLEPDKGEPFLAISVSMTGRDSAISKEQKAEMAEIRDRLATLISQAHS